MEFEIKGIAFNKLYDYKRLVQYEGLLGKIPLRFPNIFLGIEIEGEQSHRRGTKKIEVPPSFQMVEDGSLKVQGIELVSLPIRVKYMEMELRRLFQTFDPVYSQRTSIHIHMNARDFTLEELVKFLITYQIFEKSLYKFSGNRWDNNFCVPMYDTISPPVSLYNNAFNSNTYRPDWSKYYGLNIWPLSGTDAVGKLGTLEFRQMEGTSNVPRIMDWCNLITCLKFYTKSITLDTVMKYIIEGNTNNEKYVNSVFREWAPLITNQIDWRQDISECTSRVKYHLLLAKVLGINGTVKIKKKREVTEQYFQDSMVNWATTSTTTLTRSE